MLRFTLEFGGNRVVITADQLEAIADALGAEALEIVNAKWVGSGKGENGSDYTYTLVTKKVSDVLSASVLPAAEYDALRFFTAHKPA